MIENSTPKLLYFSGGLHIETVENAETINTDKAFELFQNAASFLDVRSVAMYNKSRVPGSINLGAVLDN